MFLGPKAGMRPTSDALGKSAVRARKGWQIRRSRGTGQFRLLPNHVNVEDVICVDEIAIPNYSDSKSGNRHGDGIIFQVWVPYAYSTIASLRVRQPTGHYTFACSGTSIPWWLV